MHVHTVTPGGPIARSDPDVHATLSQPMGDNSDVRLCAVSLSGGLSIGGAPCRVLGHVCLGPSFIFLLSLRTSVGWRARAATAAGRAARISPLRRPTPCGAVPHSLLIRSKSSAVSGACFPRFMSRDPEGGRRCPEADGGLPPSIVSVPSKKQELLGESK